MTTTRPTDKTSANDPLRVDFVDLPGPGRLGLTIAPGKIDPGRQWRRDLDTDLARLRDHYQTATLVSLMESHEYDYLHIPHLFDRARAIGLDSLSFPITDVDAPRATELPAFCRLIDQIADRLATDQTVVIHCRGGLGRSGTVAAACLVRLGLSAADAIIRVRHARPGAIEVRAQEQWVHRYAAAAPTDRLLDAFRGCLLGGAMGDALGYPIEFSSGSAIETRYGPRPPKHLAFTGGDVAHVSDDTQMTLFTAEGLIRASQRSRNGDICAVPTLLAQAYLRWYATQQQLTPDLDGLGWLFTDRRLHARRAPGNTCLAALAALADVTDGVLRMRGPCPTVANPPNNSKGCGAVMRAAPIGLAANSRTSAFELGRDMGVLTHGHPSGYLSAAYLAAVIYDLARRVPLAEAMRNADEILAAERGSEELARAIARARDLADQGPPSRAAIETLGGGWVGEEALAIALLCALTCPAPSAAGMKKILWRAAAHSGDSDSTSAITGNLIGAANGADALPPDWLDRLELRDTIERLAADLYESRINDRVLDLNAYPPN